ncbi:helix-turn-helix domain-containing protein [Streptacidiphilus sp. MAP5-3]|uniref:AraC family transcriptional regulator n=1 Tax=unclassified Streptacidiphilus TaxID=2643834 RepID=UPI0035189522
MTESPGTVLLRLDTPPRVAQVGVGVHGTTVDREVFRLPDLWQLHLYRYSAELVVDGIVHLVRPGCVSLVPPGAVVEFRYRGRSEHLYAHFELAGPGAPVRLPVVQDAAADAPGLSDTLLRAVAAHPHTPARTTAEVWAALWSVADLAAPRTDGPHPAVATALAHMEAHLALPLTVPEIARAAGVSHNHLTRLFRSERGDTVVGYLRRRRLEVARHLLRNSTLPITAVAAHVGIPDLQAFNKACRRELGAPPRAVRGEATSRPLP